METQQKVRQFYNEVGWQMVEDGHYQNARYEDLRPVSREYIHRCHLRVNRFLNPSGRFMLDAGSGPVQYPEYLTYSEHYQKRVCLDISIVALMEARKRLADKGFYVVADASQLPFKPECFDGLVSLHTLHHLQQPEQQKAYREFYRVLSPGGKGVVVNGWTQSKLMDQWRWLVALMEGLGNTWAILHGRKIKTVEKKAKTESRPTGTFIKKMDAESLSDDLKGEIPFKIRVWRCVNVRFLRAVFHDLLGGRLWLKALFALEERFPHYFGRVGQYPMVIIWKKD